MPLVCLLQVMYFLSLGMDNSSASVLSLSPFVPHIRILGEERSIVSTVAGTTRDAIDSTLTRGNLTYRFVDTAGIRKRGKVYYGPEFFMVNRCVLSKITTRAQSLICRRVSQSHYSHSFLTEPLRPFGARRW